MKSEDVGKRVVVIVSDTETVKGHITEVVNEDSFEVEDEFGYISRWNESQIKGIKFKGEK